MSWSVAEFTAASTDAARREVEAQTVYLEQASLTEAAFVRDLFGSVLEHLGLNPGMHIKVRGYGHKNAGSPGGNLLIEVQPVHPPKE